MIIKIEGGASDLHMISLTNMRKITDSIQKISYNFEYQLQGTREKDIYIKANKEGSFEITLGLIDFAQYKPIIEGIAASFLYDLIKKMKEYISSSEKRAYIKKLLDDTYSMAIELAEAEYYDVGFEKKKQTIEKNIKLINAEFSNYNAIKQIASIVHDTEEIKTLKPTTIYFEATIDDAIETLNINQQTKNLIHENESEPVQIENLIISGIPDNLTRASKSFLMEIAFIGKVKVRTTDEQLSIVSDYFKEKKSIRIEIQPIIKMGELIETRDAQLINIIGE